MTIESDLLSQTNDLLEKLARLNSNVKFYTQVHLLQENYNALEENFKSLQNNINSSTCNAQCEDLNSRKEPNSVDDFLVQLLLSKSKSNPPPTVSQDVVLNPPAPYVNDYQSSLLKEASAPPLEASAPPLEASAPPLYTSPYAPR
jgi:hypothetical protein